jgi:hypothetical protein
LVILRREFASQSRHVLLHGAPDAKS